MKLPIVIAALATAIAGGPVYAACSYPTAPDKLPDGRVATMDEMLTGKKAVEEYNKQMDAYLSCLKLEYDEQVASSSETLTAEQKAELEKRQVQKHNAAVDELESVASRFNEQVKVYKAAHAK
ncbi:MAG: hypothetical protein KF790_04370 [Steroidobacteraceae bacterium]|nr:hypothetical protein [Steroidobacteraceae bacterium]MCW5572775.1 hypothetical protein [Steroidobacteraceae bacterium]